MNQQQLENRVLRVLGDLCNETISVEDREWLEELLSSSPQVQALYVDYMGLHACLHVERLHAEGGALEHQACDFAGENAEATISLKTARFEGNTDSPTSSGPHSFSAASRKNTFLMAASLVGVALVSSLVTYAVFLLTGEEKSSLLASAEATLNSPDRPVVARITGTQNCLWHQGSQQVGSQPIGFGAELVEGQKLELQEGLAEITFDNGATVLLESPATFIAESPHKMALHMGRLAAVVPLESRGFRIHTRSLDVYEVGTEFGLLASRSGATEVHVFNGLVKANVLDSSGRTLRQLVLNSREAASVNSVSTTVLEFPADEAAFARNIMPSLGPRDGLLAYEGFEYPEGPLSAQNGGFGWAGPWFDIAADGEEGPTSNSVGTGSLTIKGLPPLGNRSVQTGHQNRIRRTLATSVGAVFDVAGLVENQDGVRLVGQDGNQVYLSFLQKVSQVEDGFYGLELHRGDGNSNRVLSIGNGAEGTRYGVTSNYNDYGLDNFPSLGEENTETNLFVIKISFGVDNQDTLEVYRNPESIQDEKACQVDAILKGNFAFDRISMGNFHGLKLHEVDEIRVGTHFLAVTGRWGGENSRLSRRLARRAMPKQFNRPLLGLVQTSWFQMGLE